jgi:hypothetical protein
VPEPYAALAETTSRYQAWEVALDRIELDLIRAERAVAAGTGVPRLDEWHVPDYYGPIPVALRPRAEEILARQRVSLRRIGEQLGVTAAHQALVESASRRASGSDVAVYVDVSA